MLYKFLILCFFFPVLPGLFSLSAQQKPETFDQVIWPMDFRNPITGSFAEYRNSSLHMGNDFKTYLMNGFPVKAIFDGHISEFGFSDYGYGLTFKLKSGSQGLVSRYAHLNDLRGEVSGFEELKEALRLMSPDSSKFYFTLPNTFFPIKSGQKLARTGETGTGSPHLHLEIFIPGGYINPLTLKNYQTNDKIPPTIQSVYIDSDLGLAEERPVTKDENGKYILKNVEPLKAAGKIKVKAAAFDYMTSRNPNGIYGIELFIDKVSKYKKELDRMSYSEAAQRHRLYDVNRSSLSPSNYVYNFYDIDTGYSVDLSQYPEGTKVSLEVSFFDASKNISSVSLDIIVDSSYKPIAVSGKARKFQSGDSTVSLDFSGLAVEGNGHVEIRKIETLPEEIVNENLEVSGNIYKIESINFSWRGLAQGKFHGAFNSVDKDLYLYDTSVKDWMKLTHKKTASFIGFQLSRLGYLCVMKDKSPPQIGYPYLIYRDYELNDLSSEKFINRFYSVNDYESGLKRIELLFEGTSYPFEYNRHRRYAKVLVPKSLKKFKSVYTIQLRAYDKAGNVSPWFTDLVTF
jgi:hypothetical protein